MQRDGDLQRMFGDMFEQIERDFGVDIPRTHFFRDDFFQGLQEQMQEQMEEMQRGMAMGLPGSGQAFSMRMDENGVRVEITEKDQAGKSETKVYEAPDVKSFRAKYPEIADRYLRDRGSWWFSIGPRANVPFGRTLERAPSRFDVPQLQDDGAPDNGERLGVMVEAVPADVAEFLGLEPGRGLRVQSVNDGSLGQTLGMQEGDIVLQVGDRQVHGIADVREGLGAIAEGAQVTVKVNRRGAEQTLEARKPARPAAPEKKLEKRNGGAGQGQIR
jgi:hypothetical protein